MTLILPCVEFFFSGGYVTYVFLLLWAFSLIIPLFRR